LINATVGQTLTALMVCTMDTRPFRHDRRNYPNRHGERRRSHSHRRRGDHRGQRSCVIITSNPRGGGATRSKGNAAGARPFRPFNSPPKSRHFPVLVPCFFFPVIYPDIYPVFPVPFPVFKRDSTRTFPSFAHLPAGAIARGHSRQAGWDAVRLLRGRPRQSRSH
jgi:hypothetical protein